MKFFAGLDGGQSSTVAVVGDGSGRVLGRGVAGPADEIGAAATSTRLRDALNGALEAAMRDAGIARETQFDAIVAGISGYEGRRYGTPPALPSKRVVLMHDAPVAHAAALDGATGIVAIAGTGSALYVVDDDGCRALEGGWGYLFGDEGSAFWIAREAIRNALRAEERAAESECATARAALTFFACDRLRDAVAAFYHGSIARDRFAAFAPVVLELAVRGDACASAASLAARHSLADAVVSAAARRHWHGRVRAALVGGLLREATFKTGIAEAIRTAGSPIDLVEPRREPAAGALLLACREARAATDVAG